MATYIEDENGFVTFPDTPLSKPGVFPYLGREISSTLDPDKVYQVWRPEEELNNPETIESFKLSPWFPRHEMAGEKFTPAEEVGVQGTTGQDVRFENGALIGTVKTFGSRLKAAIQSGIKELSCGMSCVWELVGGKTPEGVDYDVVQRKIRGNHLASVQEGRMGPEFSVAMDMACIALDDVKTEGVTMTLQELLDLIAKGGFTPEEIAALKAKVDEMVGGMEANKEEEEAEKSEVEDEDNSDPKMAEDEDGVKEEEASKAMDAMRKEIKALTSQVKALSGNSMDAATVEKMINEKNSLINDLVPVIGKIDGTGLDINGVAKKATDIIGLACDSKGALPAVRGYLHARSNTAIKTTTDKGAAQDAASVKAVTSKLDELGI